MACCNPFLCQPKTTTIPTLPRHHHHHHLNTQVLLPPTLSATNRSQSIKIPRSSSNTPPPSPLIAPTEYSPVKVLRQLLLLELPGIYQGPACFDALSAKLVQRAGFKFCFTSGFSVSAARLGLPDVGFMSYGEMVDQGSLITQAVSIPVIGDGDNGYGNAMNVKRTVNGFIKAGFAGIILEDQVAPKACGHTQGRKVVSREEAVMKIKAACDARDESGSDIVIVARTDSRQAISLEESLWRSQAFAEAGADVLFIDALASREEMKAFCAVCPSVPKMANMLEGGSKTPILDPVELKEIGFKIVAYPLSLIGVSMRAMEDALTAIKGGRVPPPGSLPLFDEIKDTLGFNSYYEEEKKYIVNNFQQSYGTGYSSPTYGARTSQESPESVIDILPPDEDIRLKPFREAMSSIWSHSLRINITGRDGLQKLDLRIPAGFLDSIPKTIPGLAGVDLIEMLKDAPVNNDGKTLLDFQNAAGDRIQVFYEGV